MIVKDDHANRSQKRALISLASTGVYAGDQDASGFQAATKPGCETGGLKDAEFRSQDGHFQVATC